MGVLQDDKGIRFSNTCGVGARRGVLEASLILRVALFEKEASNCKKAIFISVQ